LHPWIIEKVKLRYLRENVPLYPDIGGEEKLRFEKIMELINSNEEKGEKVIEINSFNKSFA